MIEINQQQVRDILKKINPAYIDDAIKQLLKRMGSRGRVLSQNYIKPKIPGRGTGYAQKSMRYEVKDTTATVFSVIAQRNPNRAMSIEDGRDPGAEVSARAIARWYTGDLYTRKDWQKNASKLLIHSVYRTKKYIKQLGVKGKQFISKSRDKLNADLPDELQKVAKAIEKRWAK